MTAAFPYRAIITNFQTLKMCHLWLIHSFDQAIAVKSQFVLVSEPHFLKISFTKNGFSYSLKWDQRTGNTQSFELKVS